MQKKRLFADAIGLAGLAMMGTGLWWVQPWISLVAVGALLVGMAILMGLRP